MSLHYKVKPVQIYWLKEEISIADELLSLAPKLAEEFLNRHDDFLQGDFVKGVPYRNPTFNTNDLQSRMDAWKTDPVKYTFKSANINFDLTNDSNAKTVFPTAIELTKKYANECAISSYSIIEANSVITRHTGPENRASEFLRIHIPLIIPEGDIFFECEGVEIDWSDLFGFDNQLIHSAHNYSNHRRLVYLIDISRKFLGLPFGQEYDPEREKHIPSFDRGTIPKQLHTCQK